MANRIKEMCKKHKINQIDLAKKMNVSQSCISLWQSGKTYPSTKQIQKLTELFNCTPDYLLGYVDVNLKEPTEQENTIMVYGRGSGMKKYKLTEKKLKAIQALLDDDDSSNDIDF